MSPLLNKETGKHIRVTLDVEGYKEKQVKRLERLAINLAKDCVRTKTDIHMDSMNAYERRIVHNKLTDFKEYNSLNIFLRLGGNLIPFLTLKERP